MGIESQLHPWSYIDVICRQELTSLEFNKAWRLMEKLLRSYATDLGNCQIRCGGCILWPDSVADFMRINQFFARPRRFYAFNDVWLSDMRICENSCNLNNGKYCVCDKFVWNQRRRTLNKFQIALPIYNHWYIHIYIYYIIDCQCFRSILDQSLGTARCVKLRPAWMASRRPNSEFPCVLGVRTNIKSNEPWYIEYGNR